jgi:hypothetical protein
MSAPWVLEVGRRKYPKTKKPIKINVLALTPSKGFVRIIDNEGALLEYPNNPAMLNHNQHEDLVMVINSTINETIRHCNLLATLQTKTSEEQADNLNNSDAMENCIGSVAQLLGFTLNPENDTFCLGDRVSIAFSDFLDVLDFTQEPDEMQVCKVFWKLLSEKIEGEIDRYLAQGANAALSFPDEAEENKQAMTYYLLHSFSTIIQENIEAYKPTSTAAKASQHNALAFFSRLARQYYDRFERTELFWHQKSRISSSAMAEVIMETESDE